VYSAVQILNPANSTKGVSRANTKRELVTAKNIPPSGDAKKRPTSAMGTMVEIMDSICSMGPLGSGGPEGGSWYDMKRDVGVAVFVTSVVGEGRI